MSWYRSRSALVAASMVLPLLAAVPTLGQESTVEGAAGMPGMEPAVTGRMTVRETGPLSREVELTYTDAATGRQVAAYDVELTQELHILAVDDQLNELVHEHVREATTDGRFVAELQFPHAGTYHIFTDVVPTGLGQQVLRFDVMVGSVQGASQAHGGNAADVTGGTISSVDGAYTVQLDASQLRAGHEGVMSLNLLKDGQPATDLAPYLGVAAHVVLIRAEDLAYVHAHALAEASGTGDGAGPDSHGTPAPEPAPMHDHPTADDHGAAADASASSGDLAAGGVGSHDASHDVPAGEHDAHAGIMGDPGTVPAELSVYVTPPAPGTYGLWIEFVGRDQVVTVPFKIDIPPAQD